MKSSHRFFMNSPPVDAYRWWNTTLDPLGPTDSPPTCIPPSDVIVIWNHFFPIFNLIAPPSLSQDHYWTLISRFLLRFCQPSEVPNPETHFPDFVALLYRLRMIIKPRSIANCVTLLTQFQYSDLGLFILYECPLFCGDPLLFLRGFLVLLDDSHPLFDQFVARSGLADGFLSFYLSFLRPVCSANLLVWRHHLILGEIFYKILERATHSNTCSPKLTSKFCDFLIQSLGVCSCEFRISAVRWIVSLTKAGASKMEHIILKDRMRLLLSHLPSHSLAFPYVIHFFISWEMKLIGPARLYDYLIVDSLESINLIEQMAPKFGQLMAIMKLVKAAITNKFLHRACFQAVRNLILQFPADQTIKDWMTVCVSRLTIFIALANGKRKYLNRIVLICESLCLFVGIQLGWLREAVCTAAASLNSTNRLPQYFTGFVRLNTTADESTLSEFNAFLRQRFSLKEFPFEPRKLRWVAPIVETTASLLPLPPLGKKHSVAGRAVRHGVIKRGGPVIRVPNFRRRRSQS
jgi:hypothetical protein